MNAQANKGIALLWFDAFNAHDLDGLLLLYSEAAEHYSPKLKLRNPSSQGWVRGKAALREWWGDSFDRLPSLRYEVVKLTADGHQVFMEYIRHVNGEEDLRVGEVLEIRNGEIVGSRVYHG
ncbi:MAG TPA: nuclear transport factor 2 family protein [Flavobacteriales bacterium]|nr:nuclear transport factor 2 family protein [Flavobacteriales bacterium]